MPRENGSEGRSKKGQREVCRNMVGKQASAKSGLSFQIVP